MKTLLTIIALSFISTNALADRAQVRKAVHATVAESRTLRVESNQLILATLKQVRLAKKPIVKKALRDFIDLVRKVRQKNNRLIVRVLPLPIPRIKADKAIQAAQELTTAKKLAGASFQAMKPVIKSDAMIQEARQFHRAFVKVQAKAAQLFHVKTGTTGGRN
jgi:hypothetical protein